MEDFLKWNEEHLLLHRRL